MYKQSPSRTHRSKGFKVKHALQICLLLAVCFWLIYQVKHYHDKKKGFNEHDVKTSLDSARKDNVAKLGRKDLHPLKEHTVVESDKNEEEVEEEDVEEETTFEEKKNAHEEEGKENKTEAKDENGEGRGAVEEEVDEEVEEETTIEEEENKHEEEEEGKENKTEAKDENGEGRGDLEEEVDEEVEEETTVVEEENNHEEEGKENKADAKDENGELRGSVEEEADDHDQEKSDNESDREEDFVDEEKEQENDDESEPKNKDSEDNIGQQDTSSTTNRHEAREENYKADDASSAVTLDTQLPSNVNDTGILEKPNEQAEVNNVESRDFSIHVDGRDAGQNASVNVEGEQTSNESNIGTTTNEQSETIISNSSVAEVSKDLTTLGNSTEVKGDVPLLNMNGTVLDHNEDQRVTKEHKIASESSKLEINDPNLGDNSTLPVNSNLQYSNSTISTKPKSTDLDESHPHGVTDSSISEMNHDLASKEEGNSTMMENSSISQNTEDDEEGHINKSLDESKSENSYNMKLDMEDSSDSKLYLEEKDVRTDLQTLPDIKTEGGNSEYDDAAE